jgi:ParB family transcriptional regulator, chromosome partitioning protein
MFKASSTSGHAVQELRELALEEIVPSPSQPRRHFGEEALQALAGSISERGVLQPVLVRPRPDGKHELIAGERRWRAAALAGLQRIPALLSPCDDAVALETALIENMAREDLNPVEEARACATLVKELGLTLEQVGRRVGRSRVAVSNLIRLLDLSEEILELVERGELSESHGRALLRAKDVQARRLLADEAVEEGWSVRALEARAREASDSREGSSSREGERPAPACAPSCKPAGKKERKDDAVTVSIAEAWGDLVGAEVGVNTLFQRVRVEILFHSPEAALASAIRLSEAASRGLKDK